MNCCIFLISARNELLRKCLEYVNLNYNKNYNYDILIFYHGNKYDDINFRESIKEINTKTNFIFHKLEHKLPSNINENEFFYNRKDNEYVRKSFPKEREGYLHANYFWNNFMNYKELEKYDYLIRIDDDSWFKNKIDFNLFEELNKKNKLCGTGYSWNHVNNNVLDTRVNFYKWIQDYVKKYDIKVKNKNLEKYLNEGENDIIDDRKCNKNFHSMKMLSGNFNIYNRKMFDTTEWKQYNKEFNDYAGGFKYRWGDCEIISLFYYIHIGESFHNFDLRSKDLYDDKLINTKKIFYGLK